MEKEKENKLKEKLPDWAIKQHPTKSNMTVINPMAVVDRLNEVFGVGAWNTEATYINSYEWTQVTKKGDRKVYTANSKIVFKVPSENIHLEQFGGSTNDDEGDALKGSATDALTKIASYLGVGASVYKNMGNVDAPKEYTIDEVIHLVGTATSVDDLTKMYKSLPAHLQKDSEIIAKCKEVKEGLEEIINQ